MGQKQPARNGSVEGKDFSTYLADTDLICFDVTIISDKRRGIIFQGEIDATDLNKVESYFLSNGAKKVIYNKKEKTCVVFIDDILKFNIPHVIV
jgi:hypothetical protein